MSDSPRATTPSIPAIVAMAGLAGGSGYGGVPGTPSRIAARRRIIGFNDTILLALLSFTAFGSGNTPYPAPMVK